MNDFYSSKVIEIIKQIQYATLASVSSNGDPYNAPVYTAYDKDMVFYWSSSVESQHSQNIAENGKVYMVIYDSTVPQGTGWGVYIRAEATEVVVPKEAERALGLLGDRRGRIFDKKITDVIEGGHRVYKATPKALWINDAEQDANGEFVKDYRAVVDLGKITEKLFKA